MDPSILLKTQLSVSSTYELSVKIANGHTITSQGHCVDVPLLIHGNSYNIDFYILTLGGCDIVLGIQWLQTLSPPAFGILKNSSWTY